VALGGGNEQARVEASFAIDGFCVRYCHPYMLTWQLKDQIGVLQLMGEEAFRSQCEAIDYLWN
jgi:hypothetical protein